MRDQRPDGADQAGQGHQRAEAEDELQRPGAERGDAVHGERQHLFERVFRFPGKALVPVVVDAGAAVADQRDQPAQEQVDLAVLAEGVERAAAHQAVIRVVVDHVHAEGGQQAVIRLRGRALEERVGRALSAHAVDHVAALQKFADELVEDLHVVLKVRVQADGAVGVSARRHQAGEQRVLVAAVVRQADSADARVLFAEAGDQLPCAVPAAVVHKKHAAALARQAGPRHCAQLGGKALHRFRQDFFFVVAGDDQINNRHFSFLRSAGLRRKARCGI